jgi:integrase
MATVSDHVKLARTKTPGIYKRGSRYVVVWRHRGKQHKSFHRTYEEAREAKGKVAERVLNPARGAVGMEWVSFHTFRHTCASLCCSSRAATSSR